MFSYVSLEERMPQDHPLWAIRKSVDEVLRAAKDFDGLYAKTGRPLVAPERLLRGVLLQIFYTVRSERMLVCLESRRLLAGASPVVVIAREPRSRLPVLPGDWRC
jgi:transposase